MIIDFHAHIYPEKIAEKATKNIGEFYNAPMALAGSVKGLIESGEKIGVTKYIVHSTATKPEQVQSINNFIMSEVNAESRFVGFGTMHPLYKEFEAEIARMKEMGLKGIKLHPDFQKFEADAEIMDPIYDCFAKNNLPVLFHAGDYRYDFSGPERIGHVLDKHPDLTVIAAHFGGYTEWDKSYQFLCGRKVYFDTSSTLWRLPYDQALKMIDKHGVDQFLFGVDYPMWDHAGELERFYKLGLSAEDHQKILFENGKKLLEGLGVSV